MDDCTPSAMIRQSVDSLVTAMRESSSQLADATATFALQSMQAMDAARSQAQQSAETGRDMARRAEEAATEARNLVSGMQSASDEVQDTIQAEKASLEEQSRQQTERLQAESAAVSAAFQQRIDDAIARLDNRMEEHRQTFERGLAAMSAVEAVASRVQDSVGEVAEAALTAQTAARQAQQATEQSETYLSSALTAVSTAREIASGVTPRQAPEEPPAGEQTAVLLGRLEDDYSRLTLLVQQLHERVGSLTNPTLPGTQSTAPATTPPAGDSRPASPPDDSLLPPAARPEAVPAPAQEAASAAARLTERIQVRIAPVQSFDRLLAFEDALAAANAVSSVSLGDYAEEQVTFRVELSGPTTASELVSGFAQAANLRAELIKADAGSVSIRIT